MKLKDHLDNLAAEDRSRRNQALQGITGLVRAASNVTTLLDICSQVDARHIESTDAWPEIKTPEVFYLRVEWCDRCRVLGLTNAEVVAVLLRYVQDRHPDTYPAPFFDQQGPEWTAPSKWKVRISSAHALGVLGNEACVPVLLNTWNQETVDPVRTAIALAVGALSHSGSHALRSYLKAEELHDRTAALDALAQIGTSGDPQIDMEIMRLRRTIEK